MAQNNTNLEVPVESAVAAGSAAAASARQTLSAEFAREMSGSQAANGGKTAADAAAEGANATSPKKLERAQDSAKSPTNGIAEALGGSLERSLRDGAKGAGAAIAELIRQSDGKRDRSNIVGWSVTDKDRAQAKESLANGMSDLIPKEDRALLKDMQSAIIDGDIEGLRKSIHQLADNPEKLATFVKELNKQFSKGLDGIAVSQDGKGNVLLYEKNGETAVSISPRSGEASLRAVERQADGSILLKPGEIINRTAGDIMKLVGDEATRSAVGPRFIKHFDERSPKNPYGGLQKDDSRRNSILPNRQPQLENFSPRNSQK